MKKYYLLSLTLFVVLTSFKKPDTKVKFTNKDWTAAKQQAKDENKLFFVDFDANYCAVCRTMDESTYIDQSLAEYMSANVVAHRLDVQDFDGVMWSQQYEVETLPTMLVFDSKGKLVKRLEGYQSGKDLLTVFKTAKGTAAPAPKPTTTTTTTTTTTSTSGGFKPVTTSSPKPPAKPVDMPTPAPKPTAPKVIDTSVPTEKPSPRPSKEDERLTPSNVAPQPHNLVAGLGLYEFSTKRRDTKGYAVQLGVFGDYSNLLAEVEKISKKTTAKLLIYLSNNNNKVSYKLLVDGGDTSTSAEAVRSMLKKQGYDGLIKDLSTFN